MGEPNLPRLFRVQRIAAACVTAGDPVMTPQRFQVFLAVGQTGDGLTGLNCALYAESVAKDIGVSKRTVERARDALAAAGWLVWRKAGGAKGDHAVYHVTAPGLDAIAPPERDIQSKGGREKGQLDVKPTAAGDIQGEPYWMTTSGVAVDDNSTRGDVALPQSSAVTHPLGAHLQSTGGYCREHGKRTDDADRCARGPKDCDIIERTGS